MLPMEIARQDPMTLRLNGLTKTPPYRSIMLEETYRVGKNNVPTATMFHQLWTCTWERVADHQQGIDDSPKPLRQTSQPEPRISTRTEGTVYISSATLTRSYILRLTAHLPHPSSLHVHAIHVHVLHSPVPPVQYSPLQYTPLQIPKTNFAQSTAKLLISPFYIVY
jgi:hypothetical protein